MLSKKDKSVTTCDSEYYRDIAREVWPPRRFGSVKASLNAMNGCGFRVSFLRFGLAIPFDFESMESACRAAAEINALKKKWDRATHAGIRSIKKQIVEIAERNGGERTLGGLTVKGEPPPVESLPA